MRKRARERLLRKTTIQATKRHHKNPLDDNSLIAFGNDDLLAARQEFTPLLNEICLAK